jgi:hypothetical protein
MQGTSIIFVDQLPTFRVVQKLHTYWHQNIHQFNAKAYGINK